jgi:hypothetical protein
VRHWRHSGSAGFEYQPGSVFGLRATGFSILAQIAPLPYAAAAAHSGAGSGVWRRLGFAAHFAAMTAPIAISFCRDLATFRSLRSPGMNADASSQQAGADRYAASSPRLSGFAGCRRMAFADDLILCAHVYYDPYRRDW